MAKKNKKVFKSNLKLEALEQRQLLAGVTGSGTELTPGGAGASNFITAPNGNKYDQVLLTGPSVSVQNDAGTVTRVSFLDLQGDIVQAEFSGAGTLTVSLDSNSASYKTGVVSPAGYNQTLTGAASAGYAQGLASFTISGSDQTTNFSVFSVGSSNAVNTALFDATHKGGNNTADIQKIAVVADPSNPLGSTLGSIRAGNAIFSGESGVVGIAAANVQVQDIVTVGDITTSATSTATPTLVFGVNSQFGSVTVAGGGLVEANGKSINNAGSYAFGLTFAANAKSDGTAVAAQVAPAGLSFAGNNPIAAQIKTTTLTTGVDTVVGGGGTDSINGQIGGGDTLTSLDSIDGGAGTDSLTINDIGNGTTLPVGISIKNVETLNLAAAKVANIDTSISAITGLTALNVITSTGNDTITAGAGQAVTIFDTAGKVTLVGGSSQTVTTAGGYALSKGTGAITVTDTAQGTVASTIDDGTAVTLTTSAATTAVTTGNTLIDTIKFKTLKAGDSVSLLGVTYTNATTSDASASTVATTFASQVALSNGAGIAWNSGAVTGGDTVTFTATPAGTSDVKIVVTGTGTVATSPVASNLLSTLTGSTVIGGTTKPTGAVTVTANLGGDPTYVTGVTGNTITVNGGTSVSVTEKALSTVNPTNLAANTVVNQGAVLVNGAAGVTTSVTVVQAAQQNAADTSVAVAATTEVDVVTFSALTAGQSVKVDGQTVVGPLSAIQVAAAFANLNSTAVSGWTTSAVGGASANQVTFTATGTGSKTLTIGGSTINDTIQFVAVAPGKTVTLLGLTYDDAKENASAGSTAVQVAAYFAGKAHTNAFPVTLSMDAAKVGDANTAQVNAGVDWSTALSAPGSDTVIFTPTTLGTSDVKITLGGSNTTLGATSTQGGTTLASLSATVTGADKTDAGGRNAVNRNAVTIVDGGGTTVTNSISSVSLTGYDISTITSNALTTLSLNNPNGKDTGGDTGTLTLTNTVATSLDLTLTQNNNKNIGTITNSGNAYTTLKLHVTGNDAKLNGFVDSALTTVTVDGTKKLEFSGVPATVTTVTVSGSAGLTMTAPAAVTDVNASGSSGSQTITLNSNMGATYEGGSGSDNVTISGAPTKAISGGAGTDTLTVNASAGTIQSLAGNPNLSGFEILATAGSASGNYDATGFVSLKNESANVTFSNVAAGVPLSTKDGTTNYQLKDSTGPADSVSVTTAKATANLTVSDIETVAVTASDDGTLNLTDVAGTGATRKLATVTTSGSKNLTLNASTATAVTLVDGSAMSGSLTYTTTGTLATTVKGGTGGDTLKAATGTSADVLIGGGGNDTLTANAGLDTLTGGSGNDRFIVSTPGTNLNTYSLITDASAGDVIRLANLGGAENFAATKVTLQNTAVFQDYANTVVTNGANASVNAYVGWFQFNGDTYVVESMHDNGTSAGFKDGTDLVVKLAGLVDLSGAAFVQNGAFPEIVIR